MKKRERTKPLDWWTVNSWLTKYGTLVFYTKCRIRVVSSHKCIYTTFEGNNATFTTCCWSRDPRTMGHVGLGYDSFKRMQEHDRDIEVRVHKVVSCNGKTLWALKGYE